MTNHERRVIEVLDKRGDLVTLDDGFVCFWPLGNGGALCSHDLRIVADELDRRNADWEKQINDYFDAHP